MNACVGNPEILWCLHAGIDRRLHGTDRFCCVDVQGHCALVRQKEGGAEETKRGPSREYILTLCHDTQSHTKQAQAQAQCGTHYGTS